MKVEGEKIIFTNKAELDTYTEKAVTIGEVRKANPIIKVGQNNRHRAYTDNTVGLMTARYLHYMISAKKRHITVKEAVEEEIKRAGADIDHQILRALTAGTANSGGSLVHTDFADEVIELLRATAVVRGIKGIRFYPMPMGQLTIDKLSAGATVAYRGETANAVESTPGTTTLTLTQKELVGLVAISQRLIDMSDYSVDVIIRDDLAAAMSEREDLAFIRGSGLSNTPTGLRNLVASGNVKDLASLTNTPTIAQVSKALSDLRLLVKQAKVQIRNPFYILSPRTEEFLMSLRDGNGNLVYGGAMESSGKIGNIPYMMSQQIPENIDAGNSNLDGTEIYFGEASAIAIGDTGTVEFDYIENITYVDEGGTARHGANLLQDGIRAVSRHDIGLRHDKGVAVGNKVRWGA